MRAGSEVDFEPQLWSRGGETLEPASTNRIRIWRDSISLSLSPYLSPLPLLFIDDPRGEHSGTAIRAREQNAKLYAGKKQHFAICRATLWRAYRERNNGWASRRRNERETIGTRTTEIFCADVVFKRRSRLGLLVSTSPSEMGVSRGTKVNDYSSLGQVFETR